MLYPARWKKITVDQSKSWKNRLYWLFRFFGGHPVYGIEFPSYIPNLKQASKQAKNNKKSKGACLNIKLNFYNIVFCFQQEFKVYLYPKSIFFLICERDTFLQSHCTNIQKKEVIK